jgi:transposase
MFNGVIHRLRSGCPWNRLPKQFGSDRTIHRWFQSGVMERIWAVLTAACDEFGEVHWDWQSADGRVGKARFEGKKVGKTARSCHRMCQNASCLGKRSLPGLCKPLADGIPEMGGRH